MKNFLFALLTTLLVNAMPLQAAYAQADDAPGQGCSVSYNVAITDEIREQVKAQGGTIVELEGVRAKAFQERLEELVGSSAPFSSDRVVIVTPNAEEDTVVNIGLFQDNCLKAILHLPQPFLEMLLSPLEKKPGERVD